MKNDLVEVDRLQVLNHEPALWSVIKKLPSQDCKNRFVEYCSTHKEGHNHLEVLNGFLELEYDQQKDLASLLKSDAGLPDQKSDNPKSTISGTCHTCGQRGHFRQDCPKRGSKTANIINQSQPKPPAQCLACNQNHMGQGKQGKQF